jgi:hypothetical protein
MTEGSVESSHAASAGVRCGCPGIVILTRITECLQVGSAGSRRNPAAAAAGAAAARASPGRPGPARVGPAPCGRGSESLSEAVSQIVVCDRERPSPHRNHGTELEELRVTLLRYYGSLYSEWLRLAPAQT